MKNQPGSNSAFLQGQKAAFRISGVSFIMIMMLLIPSISKAQVQELANEKEKMDERVRNTLKENAQSIQFLQNKGQLENKDVLYYFQNGNRSVYIEHDRIRFVALKDTLVAKDEEEEEESDVEIKSQVEEKERMIQGSHTFSLYLDGSNATPKIVLGDAFTTKYNYFLGEDPNAWVSGVTASKELTLEDVYPGIDLRLYSNADGSMEFDWVMDAGADYAKIKMHFEGQDGLNVDPEGSLKVGLRFTDVKFNIPESYQVSDQGKHPVQFSFSKTNEHTIEFTTPSVIDPRFPLVIDPTLSWGSFFDANNIDFDDYLFAIQVDPLTGIVYCAGGTNRQVPTAVSPYDGNGYLNTVSGLNGAADALPHVAVIYRINSAGNDILDLTHYGPSTVVAADNTLAHALSLSTNNVFIGGVTTATIPTTGSPFDPTRNNGDGFVAIFSKDLGTLNYATYLGGTGDEVLGVTSIRALSDNSFVAGLTVNAALPAGPAAPDYIIGSPADATFGTGTEMYIAKFTSNNVLSWGTYVGGTDTDVFNDLEVFGDGRVAFAGYGNGTLTEFNPVVAATSSASTNNTDGIIGVLNSTGSMFNYLDKIGSTGSGNNDRINDVEIVGDTLYWTGSASTGFPVSASGVYDFIQNGSTDVVIGKVFAGGITGYKSTYYGTASADLGNGIRLVTSTNCAGVTTTFLLVFGTVGGSGLPTQNTVPVEPFYNNTYQGGLDMFFAGFNSNLNVLNYGTYMGGVNDDYLGSTGDPRGANHLWVNNVNVYLGTTTHNTVHMPTLVAGGFDLDRTNEASGEDTHLILSIQFPSFIESDYSDAPAGYGIPSHTLNCTQLKIGTILDAEAAAIPTTLANGDDTGGSDDEDGIMTLPVLSNGGPQTVSVPVSNLNNSTGSPAYLYGWIDFNSNGAFEANEFDTALVATGSVNVLRTLVFPNVTVSGNAANHYLRIRLTTNTLNDDVGTSGLDERSTASASNGEVEDYRAISLTCPAVTTTAPCLSQAQIHTAYLAWLATAVAGGGCTNGTLTNNNPAEPVTCVGGTTTATFTYTSGCAPLTTTCMSTFTVPANTPPTILCPVNVTVSCASQIPVVNTAAVTSTDNCPGSVVSHVGDVISNQTCANRYIVTRTYRATDACGSSVNCSQTITVNDQTPPTISCPVNVTVSCANLVPAVNTAGVTASDGCGGAVTVTHVGDVTINQTCANRFTIARTYRASDVCGNSATCSQTIVVNDQTPPTISCPVNVTVSCANLVPAVNTGAVTTSDVCAGGAVTVTHVSDVTINQTCANRFTISRTYRASDVCGNSATCSQTIVVNDQTPPSITCPVNVTVSCANQIPAANTASVTTNDACGGAVTVTHVGDVTSGQTCANRYTVTRTYRATDVCGNSATCAQTILVNDQTPPSITCPINVTVSCASLVPAANTGSVTASDICGGGAVTVTFVGDVTSNQTCANKFTVTRTYRATDICGNSATCSQTILVNDQIPPSISCPVDVTVTCASQVPAVNIPGVTSSDNCTGAVTVTHVGDVISNQTCVNKFIVTRTYRSTDVCGNSATCSQTITVNDQTPPSISCPVNVTVSCANLVPVVNLAGVTSSDNCAGGVTVTHAGDVITNQTCVNRYTLTRTYRSTDACGNSSTCSQTILVNDQTPPSISCPANTTVTCASLIPAVNTASVSTTDNCGNTTVTHIGDVITNQTCANRYTVTRTYRAADDCGNSATCSQTIVVNDQTPPSISCPVNVTVSCASEVPAVSPGSVTASDLCGGLVTVTHVGDVISNQTCVNRYMITRTYRATDLCNNSATCSQNILVNDQTPPTISCPASVTVSCASQIPAVNIPGVTSSDNCSGAVTVTHVGDVISNQTCVNKLIVTRTYRSTDVCGNSATCSQTITVNDQAPPFMSCPVNVTVSCASLVPAVNLGGVTASDNCAGGVTITHVGDVITNQTCVNRYTVTRTYRATDACGNSANCSHTIVVNDQTPPSISCPGNVTVSCANLVPAVNTGSVTTTDNCGNPTVTHVGDVIINQTCANRYTLIRTYRASDECGNSATCSQTILVNDQTPPSITCPVSVTVSCASQVPAVNIPGVASNDNCTGGVTVTHVGDVITNQTCANRYTVTRTYRSTDACGNSASCSQTILVNDQIPPSITCPVNVTVSCASQVPPVNIPGVASSDNCTGGVTVTHLGDIITNQTCVNRYTLTRTYRSTDACGNTASCSQTILVNDQTPPVCQTQNITVTVNPLTGLASITAAQVNNGSSDACGSVTLSVSPTNFSCSNAGPNVVVLTVTDACGNTSTCTATVTVTGCADLSLTKTVSYNAMTNVATFTITVLNSGPNPATGIEATDQLPNGYSYISNTPSQGTYNNVSGLWLIGNLGVGASATLNINATVIAGVGLNYLNKAQITEDQQYDPDSDPETNDTVDDLNDGIADDDEASATLSTADLSLTKTSGIYNPVTKQIVFTITVLNSGPATATNVKVTDQLPNGYTYVSNTPSQGTYNNVSGLWTIGTMPNGASVTLILTATVNTGTGLNYTNAAQITDSDQIDPDSNPHTGPTVDEDGDGNGDDDDEDNVTPIIADLSLTKTVGIFNPVNNQIVFTLTILNSGPNTATGVEVTDQLPTGYTYVSSVPSQGTYNNVTGIWNIGVMANGVSRTLTITATVNTGNGLQYTNPAQVTHSDQIDPDSSPTTGPLVDEDGNGNGDDDDEDNATPIIADLSLTKTAGIFNPVNNQLVFTITVLNSGPNDATNVQVTDQLPNGYTYVSNTTSPGTSYNNVTGIWTIGSILNGASKTLTITAIVKTGNGLQYTNAAQITNSDQIDPDSSPDTGPLVDEDGNGNGDDDDEDNATPIIADLSLTKTAGIFNPVNNQLVFTITVLNSGPNDATNVQVTDQLPNGYTYVSNTTSPGTSYSNVTGLWTIGSIVNGASKTLTITAIVNTGNGLQYTNAAQITNSDQIDPDSSPDTGPLVDENGDGNGDDDDEDNATPLIADLSLTKTAGTFNPANNQLVFTITVLNSGPNDATNVLVTDQLPNGYTYVSNTTSPGTSYSNVTGIWTIGGILNGASKTLTITAIVNTGNGLQYTNAAQITNSDQIDPDSSPDTGPLVDEDGNGNGDDDDEDNATPIIADLSVTKTVGIFNPVNNQLVFTITVLNSGPDGATGVQVTDQLPNGYSYVSSVPSQGTYNNVTGIWNVGVLANGVSRTLTITVIVNTGNGLQYTNAAQVTSSDQIDPDSSPDTGPLVDENGDGIGDDDDEDNATPIIADLSLTKTAGIFNPVNNQLVFTITVLNSGPNDATNVQVTDQLPNGYTYVSNTTSPGTSYSNVTGLWTIGSILNGASKTLTITAIVITGNGLQYTNAAQITNSDQIDPDSSPDTGPLVDEDGNGNGDDDDEENATPLIADLSLTKTAGIFNPINNQLVFTITVLNSGPNDATNVQVTDQLPNGYTYVSNTTSPGTSYSNVTGIWTIGSILNGASKTLTITAIVNTGNGLQYTNAAQITNSDQIDPDSSPDTGPLVDENGDGNGDDDDEDNATPLIADLSLTKTAGTFNPVNNQLVFTITVLNSGPNDATNVQVTDQLPNGYTYVSNTASPGTSYSNVTGIWTIGSILNGTNKTLTITAIVNTGNGLQYTNAAQITNSDQIDPDSSPDTGPLVDESGDGNGDDDDEDNATPIIADLSLTKTAGIFNPVNNQLTFTITVLNSGPNDATNVQVTDQLPSGYTYVSNTTSPGTSYSNVTGIWTIGSILNGASKTLTITATVNTGVGLVYTNAAQITNSDQIDPDSSPDTGPLVDEDGNGNGDDDDEDNTRPLIADLSLSKTVGIFNPVNNQLVFTITVLNSGPDGATNVQVTDQLPSGYTYVGSVPSQGSYNNVSGLWSIGSMANGASVTLMITATVRTGTGLVYTNAAEITNSDQIDPDSSPDTGPTVDEDGNGNGDDDDEDNAIPIIADLSLTKTITTYNSASNQVVFAITVLNSGPNGATGVKVTDQLPNGFTYVSNSPSQGSYNNITGLWTIGSMANGASVTLSITATVNGGIGLVYTNAAQITDADQIDPDSSPDTGPTIDEDGNGNGDDDDEDNATLQVADLSLTKIIDDNTPDQGQNITYTITVTNSGPNNATGVLIRDILPAGLAYVSNLPSVGSYNNITGIWTVGALANGASATLQIVATVTGSGSIVNFAEIIQADQADPDSDPGTSFNQDDRSDNIADDDEASVPLTVNCGNCNVINGPTPPVCPGTTSVFNAQIVGLCQNPIYHWTVTGNVLNFVPNGSMVTVTAGSICGQSYTVNLSIDCASCGTSPIVCMKTVLVQDANPPVITKCAVTRNIEGCTNGAVSDPPFSTALTASDENEFESIINQGNVTDECGIASVKYVDSATGACPTVVTRRWTITDGCGNTATCNQTININDTVSPSINACAVTRNIEGCSTAAITTPVYSTTLAESSENEFELAPNLGNVTDACGVISVKYIDVSSGTCPIVVTRKWTVMDACGHTATCNQTINVDDNTNPVFTFCPGNSTINCPATPAFGTPTASDVCDPSVAITSADLTIPGSCPGRYSVVRTWTAVDDCGNSATCSATITVQDNTPPVIHCPSDLTLTCTAGANYVALINAWIATATATDACDANVAISTNYDGMTIPSFSCVGGLVVTFTATDDCGNTAMCTATVTKPCFNMESWVYLEGSSVNPNGGNTYTLPMRTTLNDLRVLPGQVLVDPFFGNKYSPGGQPYAITPWNYPGTEGTLFDSGGNPLNPTAGYPSTVVDWVLVSLRLDSAGTAGPVCQSAALLHNDGTIQFVQPLNCCGVNENTSYFVVVEHRNHLIVMSPTKVSFINHKISYDFRFQQSYEDPLFAGLNLFAREKEIMPGKFAMYTGNGKQTGSLNADTDINFDDRSFWESQNGAVGFYRIGDYNLNGDTNFNDRIAWERNNGKFTSVPRN